MPMIEDWLTFWLPVAGIALGIATILVSLVYMLGSALMNDRMKGWAKLELFEIIYSAVIIAIVVTPGLGALDMVDSMIEGALLGGGPSPVVWISEWDDTATLCPGAGAADALGTSPGSTYEGISACHIRLGIWYLHSIFKETSDLAFKTYLTYIYTSMAADFTINFEFLTEAAGFFTFTPWRGFFTMGNTIKAQVFDYAIKIMMLNKFQEILLVFIARAGFPALFVSGMILRTFTFTRRLGGLLLGMAIALYFIFPVFYAFGGLVMYDLKTQMRNNPQFNEFCEDISKDACKDPPVANIMYIRGEILMPGGNVNVSDALNDLNDYEKKNMSERMRLMEQNNSASKPLQGADFSKNLSLQERETNMGVARNKTESWFDDVTKQSKFDSGIFQAFKEGGPVDALSRLAFFSIFFSLFGILATIAAIRSLSVTFGGDIEIAGLTHLI